LQPDRQYADWDFNAGALILPDVVVLFSQPPVEFLP
jgi:hypothetical protein